jgi:hypothetical protein
VLTVAIARTPAEEIRTTIDPGRWDELLAALAEEITAGEGPNE